MSGPVSVSLAPAVVDIAGVRAGDANQMTVSITAGGVPVDITGMTVSAQARLTPTAPDALSAVVTILDPLAGSVLLEWPGDAVATLLGAATTWRGVWDLQLENAGAVQTLAAGRFAADMDVTRP